MQLLLFDFSFKFLIHEILSSSGVFICLVMSFLDHFGRMEIGYLKEMIAGLV